MRARMNLPQAFSPILQPGWRSAQGAGWSVQYPPDSTLRDVGPFFAWMSDRRDLVHVMFVQVDRAAASPSLDQLFETIFSRTLVNSYGVTSYRLLFSDQALMFDPAAGLGDAGFTQAWVFRWIHPQQGKMIGYIQITLYSRGYVDTTFGWNLVSAPEAELAALSSIALAPIAFSFYAIPPQESGYADSDGDGVPDSADRFPEDPQRYCGPGY